LAFFSKKLFEKQWTEGAFFDKKKKNPLFTSQKSFQKLGCSEKKKKKFFFLYWRKNGKNIYMVPSYFPILIFPPVKTRYWYKSFCFIGKKKLFIYLFFHFHKEPLFLLSPLSSPPPQTNL
jgi:hypothetical protein